MYMIYVWYMNIIEDHCLHISYILHIPQYSYIYHILYKHIIYIYVYHPSTPTLLTLPPAPAQTSRCSGVPCACPLLGVFLEPCEGGTTLEGWLEDVPKLKPIEMRGDFGVSLTKHHQVSAWKNTASCLLGHAQAPWLIFDQGYTP